MRRPLEGEFPDYYKLYIDSVPGENAIKYLESQVLDLQSFISDIEEYGDYAYLPGKWTIKEVLGHITDAERVFGYRAMRFARGDNSALPGFDENAYVQSAHFSKRVMTDIAHEFSMMRHSNIHLFKSFTEEELNRTGTANNQNISVRSIVFAIGGHAAHHVNVIRQRYLANMIK
jgi:hypothetical protein